MTVTQKKALKNMEREREREREREKETNLGLATLVLVSLVSEGFSPDDAGF